MIVEDDHPQMHAAHQDLLRKLGLVMGTYAKPLTKPLLEKMVETVKEHRTHWRLKGVDFPVLVAVVVPRFGVIDWKRADLDLPSIRMSIVNFTRMHPEVSMPEIVAAFRAAYPDLKPDDVSEKHEAGVQAHERAEDRREKIVTEAEKIVKEEGE